MARHVMAERFRREVRKRNAAVLARLAPAHETHLGAAGLPIIGASVAQHRKSTVHRQIALEASPALARRRAPPIQRRNGEYVAGGLTDAARAEADDCIAHAHSENTS